MVRRRQNGHGFDRLHDKGFKQQRKTATRSRPRNGDSMNAAAGAFHPGRAGMEKGFMLEKVRMPPRQSFCIEGLPGN